MIYLPQVETTVIHLMSQLKVDGGASANNFLMQFQADILDVEVVRPKITESTALGAAYLAGQAVGFYAQAGVEKKQKVDRVFEPTWTLEEMDSKYRRWTRAVERSMAWAKDEELL